VELPELVPPLDELVLSAELGSEPLPQPTRITAVKATTTGARLGLLPAVWINGAMDPQ
jgi:hypothetical protein